ncbi:MAG: hypothetical protein H6829_08645 [Planctomycetes bacterium]|nr:hypothetical protein [Planctomycetota bacterium]MCB9912063.1 hypothetical protein [Planctomycetota bacterium]
MAKSPSEVRRRSGCASLWPAGLVFVCLLAACTSGPRPWRPLWRVPYGYLPIPDRLELERARKDMAGEDFAEAQRRLESLVSRYPEELDLGFALQDLRREMLARGLWEPPTGAAFEPSMAASEEDAVEAPLRLNAEAQLSRFYAQELTRAPSVPNLILAARVQPNAEQAVAWLDQALALDPACAWAYYGKAYALLGLRDQYRWRNAREALEAALTLDPSHLLARRMEAWMLAQEGAGEPAAISLERWLIASEFDPRVDRASRVEARLDLARVWLSMGQVDLALRELNSLEGEPLGRPRRLMLLAVALTEKKDLSGALDAVRRASLIPDVGVLPWVQEALLREYWLEDPQGALVLWQQVLEEAEQGSDPALILQAFRARVVLERSAAQLQQDPSTPLPNP